MKSLSIIKVIIRTVIISVLVIYFGITIMLNVPAVQQGIGRVVTTELQNILKTEVEIGNIDLGILNRIIIQDVLVRDREGDKLVKIARFSAKFDIGALFDGQIRIQSVQLFGAHIFLKKDSPKGDLNFQFIIDAFASKDEDKPKSFIDLRVNTMLIRRGELHYDVLSEPETPGKFNASHVEISNLSANLSLKALTADSLNLQVKRMSFMEKSGFQLRRLQLKAKANNRACRLDDLQLTLPLGNIRIDSLYADYLQAKSDKDSSYFHYRGNLKANIVPADMSAFVPALKHFKDSLSLTMNFDNLHKRHEIKELQIYSPLKGVMLKASGYYIPALDSVPMRLKASIRQAEVNQDGFKWLFKNFTGKAEVPPIIEHLGMGLVNAELNGTPSKLDTKLMVHTALGTVMGQGSMLMDTVTSKRSFSGRLFSESLQLGMLLDDKTYGNTSFNLDFKGLNYKQSGLESYINGVVYEFDYKGYKYHNISLDGDFKPGDFSGRIALDDEHAKVDINGSFSTSGITPVFDLRAVVKDFRPEKLHLSDKYPGTSFSGNLLAKFTGNNIDNVKGIVSIDSLQSVAPEEEYTYMLPHFHILARPVDSGKEISIQSPFIKGRIFGNYAYNSVLPSVHRLVSMYVPALWPADSKSLDSKNDFHISLDIDNTDALKRIFRLPVDLQMPASFHGSFNDEAGRLFLNANMPLFIINDKQYESVHVHLENSQQSLQCQLRGNMLMNKGSMINLSLNTLAKNDSLFTTLYWGNNTNVTYSGKVVASTHFSRSDNQKNLLTHINFEPSHFILNDTVWNIHPSKVLIHKDSIDVHDIHIEHKNQYVRINGRLGAKDTDLCKVELRDINLLYIMDMIQFDAVKFEGDASGIVNLGHVLKKPLIDARLDVHQFRLNESLLGRADIKGGFDSEKGRILLDAHMREDSLYTTNVKGFVSIKDKGLDLQIGAGGTNLAFLTPFIHGIFSNLDGRAFGDIRLYGPFKRLDLEGKAKASLAMNINALNTRFQLQTDSILIKSGEFLFKEVTMRDMLGNTGKASGYLRHTKLKNLTYNFKFDTKQMLIFDNPEESIDYPFYGSIFATGNAEIQGNPINGLSVDARLRAENKTRFVYVLGAAAQAASNQFITFVDRTPRRAREEVKTELYHYLNKQQEEEEEDDPADIRLNLQIEPTPLAEIRVLMDPVAGDYISAKGTGNLRVHFFNKGDFQMFGNYNIAEGVYKISMQNVIRKDFTLRPGGTVSFDGDPRDAILNLQAVHTVPSASLNDLMPGATASRGNVRVNCLVNLSGNLTSPNMTFDLELPTVSEEDRQLVRSLTSTPEQMTTQIIYLLGVGKFYAFDYANQESQSNATSSLAFNTLSGQLNNMLSQVIDNQNWNLGTNLSTGQNGWTDVEAEAILSGRLLNNRLIINGNFGYRENTLQNSNFVGDFEAIWLLTKNGDFRLRGYNMTNDRYFTKSTMTTQGVGIIYKKDFTQWGELLDWFSNFKKHRKEKLREKEAKAAQKRGENTPETVKEATKPLK